MAVRFKIDADGNLTRYMSVEELIEEAKGIGLFPLFTKSDLAARWSVTVQRLTNWENRHPDFPKRITGVIAGDLAVYGAVDVRTYEEGRGGPDGVAAYNAALGNRS